MLRKPTHAASLMLSEAPKNSPLVLRNLQGPILKTLDLVKPFCFILDASEIQNG